MAPRNPAWVRDELILALDLYFRHKPQHLSSDHEEVIALSKLLRQLPIHSQGIGDPDSFRNPSSVYMKLCNFLRFDSSYRGKGLSAGSKMDETIWNEFADDLTRLRAVAAAIRNGAIAASSQRATEQESLAAADLVLKADEGEESYPEGRIVYRIHRSRERNNILVQQKKNRALREFGALRCEVCGFAYEDKYGELGRGFIECHHNRPVSHMKAGQKTKASDMALVCANCHRMLHRGGELLTADALRRIVHGA